MRVRIHQPRNHGSSYEIEHLRPRPAHWEQLRARADAQHFAVLHGQRFVDGKRLVHRHDFAPVQDEIRLRGGRSGEQSPDDASKDAGAEHGRIAAEKAYEHFDGKPVEKEVRVEVKLIKKDNAAEFAK